MAFCCMAYVVSMLSHPGRIGLQKMIFPDKFSSRRTAVSASPNGLMARDKQHHETYSPVDSHAGSTTEID